MFLYYMKKFIQFSLLAIFYGCTCLAQIPTQYVYVDENCNAIIPDYSEMVVVQDNCNTPTLYQTPLPGTTISETVQVEMRAVDIYGNQSSVNFDVVLLDTIPPNIMMNPEWVGYSTREVGDMYKTFYCWVQKEGYEYNQVYAGTEYTIPGWDTVLVHDTFRVFQNTIAIPEVIPMNWCSDEMAGIPTF